MSPSLSFFDDADIELGITVPPTPKPAPLPSATAASVKHKSAVLVRGMQKRARLLAKREYIMRGDENVEAETESECKKRKRNRSAFVSRQTMRHYGTLLADHVKQAEQERDASAKLCADAANEVKALQAQAADLIAKLSTLSARNPSIGRSPDHFSVTASPALDTHSSESTQAADVNSIVDESLDMEESDNVSSLKIQAAKPIPVNTLEIKSKLTESMTEFPRYDGISHTLFDDFGMQSWGSPFSLPQCSFS